MKGLWKKSFLLAFVMGVSFTTGICAPAYTVAAADGRLAPESAEQVQTSPYVTQARLINERDIELYWSEDVTGAGQGNEGNFSITVDGKDDPIYIYEYTWEENNYTYREDGTVYYDQKTSIRLTDSISAIVQMSGEEKLQNSTNLPDIRVTIKKNSVKDLEGNAVQETTVPVTEYHPFYQKMLMTDNGIKVLGSETARSEAVTKAKEMLEVILSNEKVAKRMADAGCMMGIYGEGQIGYDIPEHRFTYDEKYLYVEGFGGTQLASIKDANVLRLTEGSYTTGYPNESILTHEFGHTVKNYGLTEAQQKQWNAIYNASIASGKWKNTYAGSNDDEYFATLSAMWFNAMDDTYDGKVDGVRGPINTRAELKEYDRAAYDFLATIYPVDRYLPEPWQNGSVPNNFNTATEQEDESGQNTEGTQGQKTETDGETGTDGEAGTDGETEKNCRVTFIWKDTEHAKNPLMVLKEVKVGGRVTDIPAVKKEGYLFKGWLQAGKVFDLNTVVTSDVTLEADFLKISLKKPKLQKIKVRGKKVTFLVKKPQKCDGYVISYTKDRKFKKAVKTKTVAYKKQMIRLKKGIWFVKIRSYMTDSAGKKVLSKASRVMSIEVK